MSLPLRDLTEEFIQALEEMMRNETVQSLSQTCNYISPKSRRGATRCWNYSSTLTESGVCPLEILFLSMRTREKRLGLHQFQR